MKNNLIKYLLLFLCWFFILEILSRSVINIGTFYDAYIKNVSDAGYRLEWIKKHGPYHKDLSPAIVDTFNVYSPSRGWAVKPNVTDQLCFFDSKIVNTNSKGMREKTEYSYEKDPNRTRILIVGDSMTFGCDVGDTETYPYYLQQILPNAEIINLGVNGYGHDQMLLYLQEEGLKYHPDIILLGMGLWDKPRNLLKFFSAAKPEFSWDKDHLVLHNVPVPAPEWLLKHEFWRSKFFDLIEVLRFDLLNKTGVSRREVNMITDHILDKIVYSARKNGANIIFVALGHMFTDAPSGEGYSPGAEKLIGPWRKKGVSCIFPQPFPLSERGNGILPTGHYAPFVNERIAQGIKEYLLNNHLIKDRT